MNIKEIQQCKYALEHAIRRQLVDFQEATGLNIDGVSVTTIDTTTFSDTNRVTTVNIDVRL